MSLAAEGGASQDIRELFEIMGLKQYIQDVGPQLDAAARSAVDELVVKLDAKSLSESQRAVLEDARNQLVAAAKESIAELEVGAVGAFEQAFDQPQLETLMSFARSDVGRNVFKRLFMAGTEGKQSEVAFTLAELEALKAWAQRPGFGALAERFPVMQTKLAQVVEDMKVSLEGKVVKIADEATAKLK